MVGVSDIPCVGKVVDRISDATVNALFRGLRYMFCYKALVDDLNSEIKKVNIEEVRVSRKAAAERGNGKIIYDEVLEWQKEVKEIQESTNEFSPSWRCIQSLPIPNPISRFRQGREAVKKAKKVNELLDSGVKLMENEIAYHPAVVNEPKPETAYQRFQSRESAYGKLWDALVTEGSAPILGLYGMPGVGKTRMMEQIWSEAMEKKIFKKVVRADVGSETLDVIKVQNQIAGWLECNFESQDNVEHRASQLKHSLLNKGKILLILDDVWREIPFDVIGIPCEDEISSMGSKILLTSREKEACLRNKCKYSVKITILTEEEAWDLFKNTVGACQIESLQDEFLARRVSLKCSGLPLVIRAVGKALLFASHNSWKDALAQLEKGSVEKIAGLDPHVYACVKLSVDRLEEDAKSCLFLCSLFPEDADIYVRKLIQLAKGAQLVLDGESRICAMVRGVSRISEALLKDYIYRRPLYGWRPMVDILRASLLLDGEEDHVMKVHDLVRDTARSLAVRDPKYAFLFLRCGSRLPDDADYGTRKLLHLHWEKNEIQYPNDLVCPDLHSLWLLCDKHVQQLSGGFFNMFYNLRFLLIESMVSSFELQFSLQPLAQLMTVILDDCDITHINQAKNNCFPEKLETLCFWNCDLPVPLNIPNLKYLRKLEIEQWRGGVQMVPNTISSLSSLEELHIPNAFEIRDDRSAVPEPILVEISKLTSLKSLRLFFRVPESFQDTKVFQNLLEFNICVPRPSKDVCYLLNTGVSIKRSLELNGNQLEALEILVERAEQILLRCTDINVSSIWNRKREAFADLRYLCIHYCDIEFLARMSEDMIRRMSEDMIQPSLQPPTSFSKLSILEIRGCFALKYLFCNRVAECLMQLQQLCIDNCPLLEAIVTNEGTSDGYSINFFKLKSLKLTKLPRLKSFYRDDFVISVQFQPLFDDTVAFPWLEELHIEDSSDISDIWGEQNYDDNLSSFCKLKSIYLLECNKLESVIPHAMMQRLQSLEYLDVSFCRSLISEIGTSGCNADVSPLVALRRMHLCGLPCLTKTGLNSKELFGAMTLYPNLEDLKIWNCNSLRNVFPPRIARALPRLEKMCVEHCKAMGEIIGPGEQGDIMDVILFPNLSILKLNSLPNLTSIGCYKVKFANLVDLELRSVKFNLEEIEFGRDDSTSGLIHLQVSCDNEIQLPRKWQFRLHYLETMVLDHCWWNELNSLQFQRLKVLSVSNYGCASLFSFSIFKSLQLRKLVVSNCALLEDIVEDARGDEPSSAQKITITLYKLESVILQDLPKLRTFIHTANYDFHVPALKKVKVSNCGLTTLFTCSVFAKLQQLKRLKVWKCRLLEDIVKDARGDETHVTCDKTITLSRLSLVMLRDLPNLRSFSRALRYGFNMPVLDELYLQKCPRVEMFTSLETSTGLVSVYSEWHKGEKVADLNNYITQNRERGSDFNNSAGEPNSRTRNRSRES
ncbi:hypothetical protein ACET3Z_012456 [Daucus carota]